MELKSASIYRRGVAFMIDEFFITTARALIMFVFYGLIFHYQFEDFKIDVIMKISSLPENAGLSDIFTAIKELKITIWIISFILLFVFVSGIYTLYMYKFKNGQTFGKRIMSLIVLKKNQTQMTNGDILTRVLWSYVPWFLPFVSYQLYVNSIILYLPLLVIWFFWYDPWVVLGKRGITMHDFLSATRVFVIPSSEEDKK